MTIRTGVVLAALLMMVGCAGTPMTTRTGAVHDIKIEEGLTPSVLTVQVGDEVRWVNHRTMPVRIDFLDGAIDDVSCRRGFSNWLGMKQESFTLEQNETASVCFSKAGLVTYNVRMDSALPGGKHIVPGEIRIGTMATR
jgi:plastocyanin